MTDTTTFQIPTADAIAKAIASGKTNYETVVQRGGCGRAYACVYTHQLDKTTAKKLIKQVELAAKQSNVLFSRKPYGVGRNGLYIGYDNCDGKAWSQATQVAKNLTDIGIAAYVDGQGD